MKRNATGFRKGTNARAWFYGQSFHGNIEAKGTFRCPFCGQTGDAEWMKAHKHGEGDNENHPSNCTCLKCIPF